MALKALMRIQLLKELTSLVKALKEGGLKPIERLGKIKRVGEVRRQLTNAPLEAYAKEADNAPVKKSLGARQKLNNAAIEALRKVQAGDAQRDDPAIREALKGYSGSGGGLKSASGESGSPHEYYTPKPVAHAMWTLLSGLGFTGGKVIDPSAGMGVFAQTKPSNVAVEQVELDNVSGEINSILNDSATVSTKISPFEAMAADTEDESYDAVVTNVPFGDHAMRGAAYKLDKKYQKANLQEYFLLRGLDKIKAGGYASFIVPSGVVSGKGGRAQKLRVALSFKSEFIGAYRLPNQVFDEAGADVITDVVIFRKHGKEQFAKIEELKQQSATVLTEAKVLWDVFLDGNYFKLDGKKYQIGTSTMGMGKFGEVEKVVYEGDIVSVAKLMRPFDKSGRIDWELLNTVETAPIVYSEGDTVYSGGALLQFKDGALVPVEGGIAVTDDVAEATKAKISTVFDCVNNGVTLEDVTRVVENETREGRINDLPMWVRAVSRFGADAGQAGYMAAVTGLCVRELADKDGKNNGTNYGEQFPTLSGLLAKSKRDAAKLKAKAGGNELIGTALASVSLACNKSGFTPWWKGEVNAASQELMRPENAYDKAKNDLAEGDEYVDIATIKAASSTFDPLNDDEYAISADGSGVMHIKDYYVGSYKDFLERAKQELEQATDPAVKEKLLKQHARAMSQLSIINVSDMAFNLHSPYVGNEDKLAFLKQYVDSSYELSNNADGEVTFAYAAGTLSKNSTADEELNDKIKRRLVHYLNKGTVRTGSRNDDIVEDPEAEKILQEQLSAFISQTNSSFDSWVKASELKEKIAAQLNAPENLRFTEIPDYAPLDIDNWNPERKPHGYQSAAVRRFAKRFSGILGLDVGLGKAQPLDSKILTPTGWVLMGDIKVGDYVIAGDGSKTKVTGMFPQGEKEIFEIEFSDGSKTKCCDEHLWHTETEKDRKNQRYAKRGGKQREYLGSVKPLSEIRDSLVYQTQKNHKIPMVGRVSFEGDALPFDAYALGALIGDGHFGANCIDIACPDSEVTDAIALAISAAGFRVSMKEKQQEEGRCRTFGISRDSMTVPKNDLLYMIDSLDLKGKLSYEKFIPHSYLFSSAEDRLSMLQGLMDTDGYVCKVGVTVQFSSSSKQLAYDVSFLVQSLGGTTSISSKIPTFTDSSGEKKEGLLHYTVHMRLPTDVSPFRLSRKADRVKPKSKYIPVRYFTGVQSVGMAQAQCISVEHKSHLYVTDDFIVTHNTLTALATVQHAHNIGTKKRTIFALPNSVLSNWKKEAEMAYRDVSDCLYVGLRKRGLVAALDDAGLLKHTKAATYKYDSGAVDEDLAAITSGRFSKIFMTYEVLSKIPMRDETVAAYGEYLLGNDDSIGEAVIEQGESKKDKGTKARDKFAQENAIAKAVTSGRKSMSVPYFEDMSIDSIVVDEAHAFKNSKRFTTTGNGAFTATKFVANPSTSDRGMDAQMKCWYVRGMSEGGDGVMALTATPVTNSPLEIYSMLSVAIGEKEVNAMMGCTGANSFMNAVCKIADQAEQTVTGEPKVQRTLTGIDNLQLVRRVLESACIIETAESVAAKGIIIQVPESEEVSTSVELPVAMTNELMKMKEAYKKAAAAKKSGAVLTGAEAKASSPFNLIRNMSKLIADEELYRGAFKFTFAKQDAADAKKAVDAFNALNVTEERSEHELPAGFDPNTANGGKPVKSKAITNDDTGEEELVFYVPIKAKIDGMTIEIPAVTYDAQNKLINQLDKFGVEPLFSKASPKINALLANVKEENANPRWKPAKQIIFCDELALHHKLRLMIAAETGIPKAKIVIVNAKSVSPADIQGIQDGFNASGDDAEGDDYNKYQIIIANKKAEVGINLQSGTQAVHHMTIGWTPDSVHQRNGRAVRQGNKIDTPIRIYHYDAAGTFDSYKRHLVNVKGDWIASIMDKDAKSVDIAGDLTTEDYENMANAIGDSQAMSRIQAESAAKAQKKLLQANMTAQTNSAANMQAASAWLNKYGKADVGVGGFREWFASKNSVVKQFNSQISLLQDKLDKTDNVMMQKRHSAKIAEIEVKRDAAKAQIAGADVDSFGGIKAGYEQSEAYKNYQKEVTLNTKMRDEARNSFLLRDNLGYTKASLESLESGKSVIIGGRVISNGDFMDVNGGLGVVVITEERNYKRGGRSTMDMVTMLWTQSEDGYRKMPLNSVSINRHAPIGTKAHTDMLKELAEVCDKSVQNGHKERGIWEFAPAISEAMSEVLPSQWIAPTDSYGFKSPLFPVYLSDDFGTEFDDLRAKQKELVEVNVGWRVQYRFHDMKNMAAIDDGEVAAQLWLTANNRKASAATASELSWSIEKSVAEAHKSAVAESTTVTQYNDAMVRKISDAEPAIEFKSIDDVMLVLGKYSAAMREIKNTHNALDDGSSKFEKSFDDDLRRLGSPDTLKPLLQILSTGQAPDSAYKMGGEDGTMTTSENLATVYASANDGAAKDGKIYFGERLSNDIRAYLSMGKSCVPIVTMEGFDRFVTHHFRAITDATKSGKVVISMKESKVDIDAMIEALKSFDSINKIELGNTIYIKSKSRYSGSATMQAGQYVILDLAYKGKVQSSVSNKENGLAGRLFDDTTKRWYFPLMPLSFSDGKPVATVKDLLIHLGESEKAKEIFGA
jgi:N-6 DNA Methylase/LAGLIDADG-like domain/Helicase conserved C-terminal domain